MKREGLGVTGEAEMVQMRVVRARLEKCISVGEGC